MVCLLCFGSTAQCVLLQGPTFDAQGQQSGGRVLVWIQRMLTASPPPSTMLNPSPSPLGPSKRLVAQTALLHLLSTNVDLFSTFVDQCYAADPSVSQSFFQVSVCPALCVA